MLLRHESKCQRQRRSAFTLMEMLVVVAIIVALAGIGGFFLLGQLGGAQEDLAQAQVSGALTSACQAYKIKHNDYPDNLQVLLQKDALGGPWLESQDALMDPWSHPYQYDKTGQKNQGMKPDIWTVSPNQKTIGNWPKPRQ
jgi:general secretion pathway protein G